jgi:hypothetical protein
VVVPNAWAEAGAEKVDAQRTSAAKAVLQLKPVTATDESVPLSKTDFFSTL